MKILVTGSTGFIGATLLDKLTAFDVSVLNRKNGKNTINHSLEDFLTADCIKSKYDIAIHLAGIAHRNASFDELSTINVQATCAMAKQLANQGMKRFIFISSIGVHGSSTSNEPFNEKSDINPHNDYAVSKYHAEVELTKLAKELNFELVIIRPPLVYGISAPGNFKKLYKLASTGIPLPLGLVRNARSFISVDNLCQFILLAMQHPRAANQSFVVSENPSISSLQLIKAIWKSKNIRSFVIPIPVTLLTGGLNILGLNSIANQLFGNLEVDSTKARNLLGWQPTESFQDVFLKNKVR